MSPVVLSKLDIAKRVQSGQTIIIVHDKVYNLTNWVNHHPGGDLVLKHFNGMDATDATVAFHPDWVWEKRMPLFCIGELCVEDRTLSPVSESYRNVELRLREMNLFETDYWFFSREIAKFVALWTLMVYFCVAGTSEWHFALSAVCAGVLWHQAAFFAHDAGHSGITHVSLIDQTFGIVLTSLVGGLSLGWWKRNHNVHHIVTNEPENDPDIQHLPFFAVSTRFVQNIKSSYYDRVMPFDGFAKIFVPIQHYTFYIVLAFGRFNLYVQSWAYVLSQTHAVPYRRLEIVCMSLFWVWFLYMVSFLPSASYIAMYVLVSHMITFILHAQITLSHFGMSTEVIRDETYAEKAFRTTTDVDCPRWMDWFHGGLQVEHHLYPRVPRHNLRKVQPLIKELAAKHNLQFHHFGFIDCNIYVLGVLKKVAHQVYLLISKEHAE